MAVQNYNTCFGPYLCFLHLASPVRMVQSDCVTEGVVLRLLASVNQQKQPKLLKCVRSSNEILKSLLPSQDKKLLSGQLRSISG